MIGIDEALALYGQHVTALPPRSFDLGDALGHVLAQDVQSRVDLPMFTQSAVDGYALRSADCARALRVIGEIPAGAATGLELPPGCAARIFTGGRLPQGADACARQEIVDRAGDEIRIREALAPGADTRFRGEEVAAGDTLAHAGQRLHSGLIAALAMAGVDRVLARPRPRVALVVTGDEVSDSASQGRIELADGKIHDANGPLVRSWVRERGYPLVFSTRAPDAPEALRAAIAEALSQADVVFTTGGVSVGDRDYVPEIAAQLGIRQVFWKVAQKPGKPLWFGVDGAGRALLAFPGNPAAVLIGLHVHATRLLALLEGEQSAAPAWRRGVLAGEVRADAQRDQLIRVGIASREDGVILLTPLPRQQSHMLSNLAAAAGLAWIRRAGPAPMVGAAVPWLCL